ncbi:hypothetical protein Pla22_47430 [Rubripirellula amarantea]|uniref:Type II secretion system protein GspE N-terminal domain-containing protein n=1 Tax=Rubripirellula amarantea TaxID=2527999 RepID=A0A5C5WFA6_9BACT|nr:hypothetical protein [Rubripirellula amarantea]TWT49546.1 hypothetical protein Pla22_47430 [Rubripirellula amarantea]
MNPKADRDCPKCGTTFGSVIDYGVCPNCNTKFYASPTHIALAGRLGACSGDKLLIAIAAFHSVPVLLTLDQPICDSTRKLIPESTAREFRLIPVVVDDLVRIAVPDPLDERLFDTLTSLLGDFPSFAVARDYDIRRRINESYGCIPSDTMDFTPGRPVA